MRPGPWWIEPALVQDEIEVVVQVNGKLRGRIVIPVDADENAARDAALADANVQKFVERQAAAQGRSTCAASS